MRLLKMNKLEAVNFMFEGEKMTYGKQENADFFVEYTHNGFVDNENTALFLPSLPEFGWSVWGEPKKYCRTWLELIEGLRSGKEFDADKPFEPKMNFNKDSFLYIIKTYEPPDFYEVKK